jgi:hypothetical protein
MALQMLHTLAAFSKSSSRRALKRAMKIVIGRADLHQEGFQTCVSKVMFMLNKQPIQQSGRIQDQAPLMPNSFVPGDLAKAVLTPDFPEVTDLDQKLKQQVKIQKAVWKRFFLEFVPLLSGLRSKTTSKLMKWSSGINYVFPKAKFNLIFILFMCESNIRTFLICMQFCIF